MTRHENAHQELNLAHLADPLARIATMLAAVSAELEQLSERVGGKPQANPAAEGSELAVSAATPAKPGTDAVPASSSIVGGDESGPAEAGNPRASAYSLGEPVDTSFAAPSNTPAASAAGASPFTADRRVGLAGWQRWRGRASPALWIAGTVLLLGILALLLLFKQS